MGYITWSIWLLLFTSQNIYITEAKRIYSSGSRRSSSSSSANVRRTSYHNRSNYGGSLGSSHTKANPSLTHTGLTSMSYAGYNSQSKKHNVGASNIGWTNPSKTQGPPPAYSPKSPAGGAMPNINEKPPAYNPSHATLPSYSQNNRPSSLSSSNVHTPITAANAHNVQSSYPKQQVPSVPYGSNLSPGANYHSSGSIPPGATLQSTGALPPGATYHSSGSLPLGATYHSPNSLPPGATYYPSGSLPPSYHPSQGTAYYPSYAAPPPAYYSSPTALPAGATYLPVGSALPAGATLLSQPPKSSSGLGFGSGLLAGGLTGALLGHALTPTQTRVIDRTPYASGGGGPIPTNGGSDDKIIIINNGPPGSVTTAETSAGVTVINTSTQQQPPMTPIVPAPQLDTAPVAAPVLAPTATDPSQPQGESQPTLGQENAPPPNGGIICVPIKVPQPDPKDNTKTIEVEKIVCYPAPSPIEELSENAATNTNITKPETSSSTFTTTNSINLNDNVTLESFSTLPPNISTPESALTKKSNTSTYT